MGYFHMLGYELSSHELVPLPFSIPFEKKRHEELKKKTKMEEKKRQRRKKKENKYNE